MIACCSTPKKNIIILSHTLLRCKTNWRFNHCYCMPNRYIKIKSETERKSYRMRTGFIVKQHFMYTGVCKYPDNFMCFYCILLATKYDYFFLFSFAAHQKYEMKATRTKSEEKKRFCGMHNERKKTN